MARGRRPARIGPLTNIIEEPGAWTVRVERGDKKYAEYFGNAVWGGKKRAKLAAQRWRDELLLRIDPDTRVRREVPKGRRSETGVAGVSVERHKVHGRVYPRIVAHWQDLKTGKTKKTFSVALHGWDGAKALAVEAREAGVARYRAQMAARQQGQAVARLEKAGPMPRPVKDPLSRKGISMARRRPRRVK